jgi:hypothetical protein
MVSQVGSGSLGACRPLSQLDRPLPGSAGSLAADPLDREHPDADHDEKPTTAAPAGDRHRYQQGGGSGQAGEDHAWQWRSTRPSGAAGRTAARGPPVEPSTGRYTERSGLPAKTGTEGCPGQPGAGGGIRPDSPEHRPANPATRTYKPPSRRVSQIGSPFSPRDLQAALRAVVLSPTTLTAGVVTCADRCSRRTTRLSTTTWSGPPGGTGRPPGGPGPRPGRGSCP